MRTNWTIAGWILCASVGTAPAFAGPHNATHGAASHPTSATASPKSNPTGAGSHSAAPATAPVPGTNTTTLNPIAAKIASKPQLSARLTAMLPQGMTLNQASAGFRNQGQFIAALHVSQNLHCDCFQQIRTDMVGKHMSLGQSIQDVKKTANTRVEVRRAEAEADADIRESAEPTTAGTSAAPGKTGRTERE